MCLVPPQQEANMARPRPVFSARCTSLPLGVGSAGLATLAFAAPPPKGREVQEDKGNLQKHFYTPIERRQYLVLKAYFEEMATKWSVERLAKELGALPFERYAPVRNQLFMIWRAVNRRRKEAGLETLPQSFVPWKRRPVSPFAPTTDCCEEKGVWTER